MTREQLKGSYSEREATEVYRELQATKADLTAFARAYMHDPDYQVARNSLWVLTKTTKEEMKTLQPLLQELIELGMESDNPSVGRLALTLVDRLEIGEEDLRADFLNFCLDRMVAPSDYSALQAVCMKQAYRMCRFYPELMEELVRILRGMEMDYYKPAVHCVRRKILAAAGEAEKLRG